MKNYLQLATTIVEGVTQMLSRRKGSAFLFNDSQCKHLAEKLQSSLRLLKCNRIGRQGSEPMFKEYYRAVVVAASLVRGCCEKPWLKSAILLSICEEDFALRIFDLYWCETVIIWSHMDEAPNDWYLRVSRIVEDEWVKWRQTLMVNAYQDQTELYKALKSVQETGVHEDQYLARYLLQRLHTAGQIDWVETNEQLQYQDVNKLPVAYKKPIGSGGSGAKVYKTKWMGRRYAEKVFRGVDKKKFTTEINTLAELYHPHIVRFIGCIIREEQQGSIVMEFVEHALEDVLHQRSMHRDSYPFELLVAVDVLLQIAEGLRYLHDKKVSHRDLKSSNILLTPISDKEIAGDGYVNLKVVDFGLAKTKVMSMESQRTPNTGTTRWMAPELYPGNNDETPKKVLYKKTDVYSFAMVGVEILTGKLPFASNTSLEEVRRKVLKGDRPEIPESYPIFLRSLIRDCWRSDAENRPSFHVICNQLRLFKALLLKGSKIEWEGVKPLSETDCTIALNLFPHGPVSDRLESLRTMKKMLDAHRKFRYISGGVIYEVKMEQKPVDRWRAVVQALNGIRRMKASVVTTQQEEQNKQMWIFVNRDENLRDIHLPNEDASPRRRQWPCCCGQNIHGLR